MVTIKQMEKIMKNNIKLLIDETEKTNKISYDNALNLLTYLGFNENLNETNEQDKNGYIYKETPETKEIKETKEYIKTKAKNISLKVFGNKVFMRGLIEFSNYCKNDCLYCGIRKGNKCVERYRLSKEEIMQCCKDGYELGFRTFVLQSGEDLYFTEEIMTDIVKTIKNEYKDVAVTLSIGEKEESYYKNLKLSGVDRFLLRHETAEKEHYSKLHPKYMKLIERKNCIYTLKKLGFQTGVGFMVGSPFQKLENIAKDLIFMQEVNPEMIGIGPFLPHKDTPFREEKQGSIELTLILISILRLIFPKSLIPATTALGTIKNDGRERGILAGANVVMPNLSPLSERKKYMLYDNKISTGLESKEGVELLKESMKSIGYILSGERGDFNKERTLN